MVSQSTTGWVDPTRLATTQQRLVDILSQINSSRSQLSGSSAEVATMLYTTIDNELTPPMSQILNFDGWHRWEVTHVLRHSSSFGTTFRFGIDQAALAAFAGNIARGAFNNTVVSAFAEHLADTGIDIGFAGSELHYPGSEWAMLLQRASSTASTPMSRLLAAVITNDHTNRLARSLANTARSDQNVAQVLQRISPRLGDGALQSVLIELTSPKGTDRIPGIDPVAEQIALNAVLENVASRPEVARVITDDLSRLERVVTNPFLDPSAVEGAGRAGLAITGAGPLLQSLVAIHHARGELTHGGVRLAATALISDLDRIATTIDLPIVRSQGPYGAIDIGTRDELSPLLANILNDSPSRAIVGIALHDLRETRVAQAIAAWSSRSELDLTSTLAGQLTDINDLSHAFDQAATTAHDAEMLHRSELFGGIDLALSVAGRFAMVSAPMIGGTAALTLSGSRELVRVINTTTADDTPPDQISELVSMATTVSVLRHVAEDSDIHENLHLTNVSYEQWNELTNLVTKFETAATGVEKARSYGDLVQLCRESIELTTFLNEIQALSVAP